jgi:RHS repeat-associated protein
VSPPASVPSPAGHDGAPTGSKDAGAFAGRNGTVGCHPSNASITALDAAANESAKSPTWSGAAASGAVTTTYAYDPENHLSALQTGSTVLGTYAYDGAGDRVSKTVAGATTAYTLDLASGLPQVLSETTGSTTTSYAYAGGPLELDRSGTTYWYLSDTLGSVRLLTDSTGATPATYAYAAFGSTRKSTGSIANEVRFSGERTDTESGLEFLRARTYDPSTGTFLQRDTWGISPTDSQSIDAYCYTANNPTNAVDPSGHISVMYDGGRDVSGPGTTITQSGPGAYTPPVTGKTQGPPSSTPKSDSTPKGCSLLPWESGNCEGQAAGGIGNLWAQGPGGFINDHATQIAVVAIIAGSLFVCNVGSEACAALLLTVLEAGGTVCAEDDEACLQAAEGGAGAGESAGSSYLQLLQDVAGNPVGVAGSRETIRELPGGLPAAESTFQKLTAGGTVVSPPTYGGAMVKMPDGTVFGMRLGSDGVPTIDVNIPGNPSITKLKFP